MFAPSGACRGGGHDQQLTGEQVPFGGMSRTNGRFRACFGTGAVRAMPQPEPAEAARQDPTSQRRYGVLP